jgi:short-subunit dehydrogenase
MGSGRRVLVTGATSGLGREMAVQLARRGCRVALTGRRAAKLESAAAAVREAGGEPLPLLGCVTEIAVVREHYARIKGRWGGLDWAILNAGVGDSKGALEFSAENYRWTLATNVGGVVNWLEAVLPDMIAAGSGTIAGISSLAAFRGLPKSGPYCASKAALLALLESIRLDLRGTGVKVVTVCPGWVRSELTSRNDPRDMKNVLDTADGARRILRGVEKGQRLVHFPWQVSWPMVHIVRHLPGWLYDRLIGTFAKKHPKKPYIDESRRGTKAP